jgi:hypothetical protein
MRRSIFRRPVTTPRLAVVTVLLLLAVVLATAAPALGAGTLPSRYVIQGVPLWQQQQALGCGAASVEMVMDYWGPFVDQREVYNVARTWQGSAVPDLARAGQFSSLSYPQGTNFPSVAGWGYAERPLGYSGFYYARTTPWLDELKAVVAKGYPVVCLTDWLPGVYGPHYRVVVGYDDSKGVLYVNDPWCREFKHDVIDTKGSFAPNENVQGTKAWSYVEWTYADWLAVWQLPADDWGLPGWRYAAVLVAPWKTTVSAPASGRRGSVVSVTASVTYSCAAPFGGAGWPAFPASDSRVDLTLPAGWTVVGGSTGVTLGTLPAGGTAKATMKVQVPAGAASGAYAIGATGSGLVSGSLGPWQKYDVPYSYTDRIGGSGSATVTVK